MLQGGSLWAGIISGGLTQIQDTRNLTNGQMDKKRIRGKNGGQRNRSFRRHGRHRIRRAARHFDFTGAGTIVGSIVGGLVGDRLGRVVGVQAGNALVHNPMLNSVMRPAAEAGAETQSQMMH